MSRIAELGDKRVAGETAVFAYGFNAAGFHTHHESLSLAGVGRIEFLDFYDSTTLEAADGVIIPQGIFEEISSQPSRLIGPRTTVAVDKSLLLERERQVFNLLRAGKWVCFLVGEIVDEVSQGIHLESIADTDLCKRILNAFTVGRRRKYDIDTPREVRARGKEFESYVRHYGTPTTVFEFPHLHPIERHVIIEFGEQAVGIELDAQLFFLPFHSTRKDSSTALAIAQTVARSITQYRKNRIVEIPRWVDELKFKNEEGLYLEINSLLEKVNRLESQLLSWKDYKGILTTSGNRLRNKVVAILESVFEFKVDQDQNRESLIITDHNRRPILMMDARGTEGSVEKDFIDEIHRHRKIAGLPDTMPAVLLVNSDMLIHDITKKAEARVRDEVVNYAKDLNVLIVRTIDLLLLMRQLEKDTHRGSKLTRLLLSGGGWLKMDLEDSRTMA
jgi:hypothetical protein